MSTLYYTDNIHWCSCCQDRPVVTLAGKPENYCVLCLNPVYAQHNGLYPYLRPWNLTDNKRPDNI